MNVHQPLIARNPRRHARSRAWRCVAGQAIADIDNGGGTLAAGGDLNVTNGGALKNGEGGVIVADGRLKLSSLGSSASNSTQSQQARTVAGSTVAASGNVSITATGAGQDSNLTIQGSNLSAGNDIHLKADNRIDLLAAQNTNDYASSSSNHSASVGAGINLAVTALAYRSTPAPAKAKAMAAAMTRPTPTPTWWLATKSPCNRGAMPIGAARSSRATASRPISTAT